MDNSRIPPNDYEAEQAVLSSMIFDKDAVGIAYEGLVGDDFYRSNHSVSFDSMVELFIKNVPIDLITLKSKLDERGVTTEVGGSEYLAELAGGFSTSANIKHYVKIVKDKSMLRRLIKVSLR